MRKINKGEPLTEFTQYKKHYKPKNWEEFSHTCGNLKQEIRKQILDKEQGNLCGYTELPIGKSTNCHIDHYHKIDYFPNQMLDWDNFVVAVDNEDFGAKFKDSKKGIKKNEYNQILNPVSDYAETYFEYSRLGDILPRQNLPAEEKAVAERTIEIFNLRHPSLRERRYALIKLIEDFQDFPTDEIKTYLKDSGFKSLIEQYTRV